MAKTYYAGPEKVAVAFLKTFGALPADKIATSLPTDAATWRDTGFIQVQSTGGSPDSYLPVSGPVVTVDVWANAPGRKSPWGQAESLAETIKQVLMTNPTFFNQALNMGDNFHDVTMHSAWVITEPRRVENDDSAYARYTFEIEMHWSAR